MSHVRAKGRVTEAFGNLLKVEFEGNIRQGEVCFVHVGNSQLKAEVIAIIGNHAKAQVFEDTRGIKYGTEVSFHECLLEAELGPGLLSLVVDGLQNPLEKVAEVAGLTLTPGIYIPPLDRQKKWEFTPTAKEGEMVESLDFLGTTMEGHLVHQIMVPSQLKKKVKLVTVAKKGLYTVEDVIATAIDDEGKEHSFRMMQKHPIKIPLIRGQRIQPKGMLDTGVRIVDGQFPIVKGGTFCTPGPFGAGKTVLQHLLAKHSSVDVVVVCACGERAGEVVEVLREFPEQVDREGKKLIERTVIICNTSSMPVAAREASVYLGATISEYYRQMGHDVLLLADSTSRWAQAMREMSARLEEIPGEEAFPAYLASRIAAFYERAGMIRLKQGKVGSLTIGGAVSPAGGNFEEPVTQATLAVVGAFLALSRARSDARRYPAIDPIDSWSKYQGLVADQMDGMLAGWGKKFATAYSLLTRGHEIGKRMEVIGEEGISLEDMIVYLKGELYDNAYLQQHAFHEVDKYAPLERQADLIDLLSTIFDGEFQFDSHDDARTFFLLLESQIKNMNQEEFDSDAFKTKRAALVMKIDEAAAQAIIGGK